MVQKHRKYGPEFKRRAVELAHELSSVGEAAKKLGIPKHTLYSWVRGKQEQPDVASTVQELPVEEQLRALRRENEELKKANHILKQAAAFFSQDHLK